jgi:TetR/AcrR family transcriptional repressor of nem operon
MMDKESILDGAVQLFWQQGYAGTSMDELVKATGISRYRFYELFESKRSLFLEVLDHYHAYYFQPASSILHHDHAGLGELRAYFARQSLYACGAKGRQGCLIFNSMAEAGAYDLDIALQLRGYRDQLIKAFAKALHQAQRSGEIDKGRDVVAMAASLYLSAYGMMTLCRLRGHEEIINHGVPALLNEIATQRAKDKTEDRQPA